VIDLSQVSFLDSAALGLLMVTHRQLLAEKRRLSICKPQSTVKQIIELANLHKTISIVDSDVAPAMKKSA
jgi:anti-anti-sigma factor